MVKNITRKNERNAQKHEARGLKKVFACFCVVFACAHDSGRDYIKERAGDDVRLKSSDR